MKLRRGFFAFALALVLVLSVFAFPAKAATEDDVIAHTCAAADEVQPRYAIGPCLYCGGRTVFLHFTIGMDGTTRYTVAECVECGAVCAYPNP